MPAQTTTVPSPGSYSEGFFSSPVDLANIAIATNLAVTNVDNAITASETTAGDESTSAAPESWIQSWDTFKLTWQGFYQRNFASGDGLSWLTSDLENELESYQRQISSFAAQAASYGISVPGGVPSAPASALSGLPTSGAVIGTLALVLAIFVIWKVA